ncbi:Prohibitin-1, subunit of the prohibitin complex (Phb1p-Phb2p) [Saguinus oedipus]|uniref:Prohibitin n=1 Tax=Saguinus oedipus TaxID=9490 RepID=A0ABQ9W290_SAGOE|nr:Prohibitin-1, subunit of the prohibitin complex (Phb1p-Phb2p) [Saguinus oedipus]
MSPGLGVHSLRKRRPLKDLGGLGNGAKNRAFPYQEILGNSGPGGVRSTRFILHPLRDFATGSVWRHHRSARIPRASTLEGSEAQKTLGWLEKRAGERERKKAAPDVPVITGSKYLQNVTITLSVLFRPIPSQLPYRPHPSRLLGISTSMGEGYDEGVLLSIMTEILKQAATFGLILADVSLTDLTFGKEFTEVVEAKQVTQQETERARFAVEKAEQKKAAIIFAEGDSKAAELIVNLLATTRVCLMELHKLEAAEDIAHQL